MKTFASLTAQTMSQIHDDIDSATGPTDGLVVTLNKVFTALGSDWVHASKHHRIDPTQYSIPAEQWSEICTWLGNKADCARPWSFLSGVDIMLDWVNFGPSHFTELEEIKL